MTENQSADLADALHNEREARKIAGAAADRFRDVITEVLNLPENPGDDALIEQIRARHGKTGPEPTTFRDFCAGAVAHLEANGHRWQADAALDGLDEFHPDTTHNPSGDAA
jgi:hypothetical protein